MRSFPAPLSRRFLALLVDYLVIVAYIGALAGVVVTLYLGIWGEIPDLLALWGPAGAQALGFLTLTLPIAVYLYLFETSVQHATPGKRAAGIMVASGKGAVRKRQILLRTVVKLLPWELAHAMVYQVIWYERAGMATPAWVMAGLVAVNALPLVYLVLIWLRHDHRGPHDLIAGTIVIKK